MRLLKRIFLFSLFWILPVSAFAHEGNEHVKDMKKVFPFFNQLQAFDDLCWSVTYYLDKPNGPQDSRTKPLFIDQIPNLRTVKWTNHRIWYHWGFNTDPRDFTYLTNDCIKYYKDHGLATDSDISLFWNLLLKDQDKRRRAVLKEACAFFYDDSYDIATYEQKDRVIAFVTILYSVHILGDLVPGNSERHLVQSMDDLSRDMDKAIDVLSGFAEDKNNQLLAKNLKEKLDMCVHHGSIEDSASLYLNTLIAEFPRFLMRLDGESYYGLSYNYKEEFRQIRKRLQ